MGNLCSSTEGKLDKGLFFQIFGNVKTQVTLGGPTTTECRSILNIGINPAKSSLKTQQSLGQKYDRKGLGNVIDNKDAQGEKPAEQPKDEAPKDDQPKPEAQNQQQGEEEKKQEQGAENQEANVPEYPENEIVTEVLEKEIFKNTKCIYNVKIAQTITAEALQQKLFEVLNKANESYSQLGITDQLFKDGLTLSQEQIAVALFTAVLQFSVKTEKPKLIEIKVLTSEEKLKMKQRNKRLLKMPTNPKLNQQKLRKKVVKNNKVLLNLKINLKSNQNNLSNKLSRKKKKQMKNKNKNESKIIINTKKQKQKIFVIMVIIYKIITYQTQKN